MPVRTDGNRRSKRLSNEAGSVEVQAATLEVEDADGEIHHLIQLKFWTKTRRWSMFIFDVNHNPIACAGPRSQEISCWEACVRILEAKGYWLPD